MTTSLGRMVSINPATPEFEELADDDLLTFMPLEACWPDGRADTSRTARYGAVAGGYTRFRDGDVLLPKITPTFEAGRVFVVSSPTKLGVGTTELHVLRVGPQVDPRFITYVCRSRAFLLEGHKSLQGVGNLRRVPVDFIKNFQVQVVEYVEQKEVADYLDGETSRLDRLIAKQEELVEALRLRRAAMIEAVFASGVKGSTCRVGHLLAGRPRYGVLVPKYVAAGEGVPMVRVGDLLSLAPDRDIPHIAHDLAAEYPRTSLRGGEILLGVVGKMGQSTVAPPWLRGANVNRAVAVLRPRRGVSARLLSHWFGTQHFLQQAELATSGDSVQATLGMADLARFSVTWPDDVEAAVARVASICARHDALISKAEKFIELARERRAALIDTAVAGQIDVRETA